MLRNEGLLSLVTDAPGYPTHIVFHQAKLQGSYEELRNLRQLANASLNPAPSHPWDRPIYMHGNFSFGLLICSDLTNILNRAHFQGYVDSLFVVEWNQDLPTFGFLVDSAAHDVHAYIVQANNRLYGDSRIRGPLRVDYMRDVVRVRGGIHDYFVIGKIDHRELRDFQSTHEPATDGIYKPFPIGFQIAEARRLF